MSPVVMTILLIGGWGVFAFSAYRRWKLLKIGSQIQRTDRPGERLKLTIKYALGQARMPRYEWSGLAHVLVFSGFVVLLLRSVILWTKGYDEQSDLWFFGPEQPLGMVYAVFKDTFVLLVLVGTTIFFYYRVIRKLPRLTLNFDGLVILLIIAVMMLADVLYDAAHMALPQNSAHKVEFLGYAVSGLFTGLSPRTLTVLEHAGFWTHITLVLIFLNLLPYSKHFHVITALPNVYTSDLTPRGRLQILDDIEGRIEREEPLGVSRIEHFDWKSLLDMYTCTECGRCSDVCPATGTGKLLSPKHLMVDLRNHLYSRQREALGRSPNGEAESGTAGSKLEPIALVGEKLIKPEVLWACTTCRACEEECPVFISYVDKIVDMRRSLVMEQAVFPDELQNAFRGLETAGNPWSYPPDDRTAWAQGLDIPLIADKPDAEVLLWVGCAPAFDARARSVTVATARLLKHAGVDFAILGTEETCTGDPARRAGNEFLFQMMAQQNAETLKQYPVKKIVASCPHCFNTLKNEYPDFDARFEVVHHTEYLNQLVQTGRLQPKQPVNADVTFHDSCYLGRYNGVYDAPREALRAIPGVRLSEPVTTRDRGLCCGAGGAQMFKEEEAGDMRVNAKRTGQLVQALDSGTAGEKIVSSACPFCMRMITDGLADSQRDEIAQLDVAEILCKSILDT